MSDLVARFKQAAEDVTKLSEAPDNQVKLKLYALYKQGTDGDVSGDRPGLMDFVGRAKYDAWDGLKGTSKEEAIQKYIDLVEALKAKE